MEDNNAVLNFTGQLPLTTKALTGTKSEYYLPKFAALVPKIQEAIEKEEIVSTVLAEVKDRVNRMVNDAYNHYVEAPYYHSGMYESLPESLKYMSAPMDLHGVSSYSKKLNKIPAEDKIYPMFTAARELTDELLDLWHVMAFLKAHTISSKDKKKQEMDAKQNEEDVWMKKLTSHEDSKKVIDLLNSKAEYIHNKLYHSQLEYLSNVVKRYKESVEKGQSDYQKIFYSSHDQYVMQKLTERVLQPGESLYSYGKDKDKPKTFKLVDNYIDIIKKDSKRTATEIVNHFVYKNTQKLSYILYNKNNLDTVQLTNVSLGHGYVECTVECKFKDGSEFLANTSVVSAHSKYGKPFYRFPTIFSNVIMPDGKALKNSSEQRMDEIFAVSQSDNTNESEIAPKKPKFK